MALTPISKLARISPLSGNSVFPIVQNGTTYGAEISSVNYLNNLQTVTDAGFTTTNSLSVASLTATGKIIGGINNTANGDKAAVLGGENNTASGNSATIAGGYCNTASGNWSNVGGGKDNAASGSSATIAGGYAHRATSDYSFVGGGGESCMPQWPQRPWPCTGAYQSRLPAVVAAAAAVAAATPAAAADGAARLVPLP